MPHPNTTGPNKIDIRRNTILDLRNAEISARRLHRAITQAPRYSTREQHAYETERYAGVKLAECLERLQDAISAIEALDDLTKPLTRIGNGQ